MKNDSFSLLEAYAFTQLLSQRFDAERELLNRLDNAIGDGDHGETMANGLGRAAQGIGLDEQKDLGTFFDSFALKFMENTGGAIGPLVGGFFAEGALVFKGTAQAGPGEISGFLSAGLEAVQEIGGAVEGDKTLVDALAPAARAASQATGSVQECLQSAIAAAAEGIHKTRQMQARRGRARFLQARSVGAQDAGATCILFILETLAAAAAGETAGWTAAENRLDFAESIRRHNFVNSPERLMPDNLAGFAAAYPDYVRILPSGLLMRAHPKPAGKVGLAMGHGGGHEPAMCGFIGYGLLDTDMTGPLFTCAPGTQIRDAILHADRGAGVILLVSNHEGDVLNARLAVRQARQLGIEVRMVLLYDDIATAPRERVAERRGKGGMTFALKTAGAAAERGYSLDEVERTMVKTNDWTVAVGVALRSPLHPVTGGAMFDLQTGQMEVGVGGHGEAGIYQGDLLSAEETMDLVGGQLLDDLPFGAGDEILVFLDSSGGLPMTELHALFLRLAEICSQRGILIYRSLIGEYYTTQQMGGFTLSLCKVDAELKSLWSDPANGAYFKIFEPGEAH